jgi:predicted dehydrogenase
MTLKLGIIGMSEGNGHPYSWSAIFNGYDAQAMARIPFPAIPAYLAERRFPEDAIPDARVTHVWTQDAEISHDIARAALIANVVSDPRDMLGRVDAVLLARDDAENHLEFAAPFLAAGLPLYVDKPIATSDAGRRQLLALQVRPGQVFTCSALRYARELQLTPEEKAGLGTIRYVQGTTPKSWERYAVHLADPVLAQLGDQGAIAWSQAVRRGDVAALHLEWKSGVRATFEALGKDRAAPIALRYIGEKASVDKIFRDSFGAFKRALEVFVEGVHKGHSLHDEAIDAAVVRVIEAGLR